MRADTRFRVGDSFSYRKTDLYTKLEMQQRTITITEITDTEVIYDNGRFITDLLGNWLKRADGARYTPHQDFIAEYSVGKKWTDRYRITWSDGSSSDVEYEHKVVSREKVTVPAGTFDAYRIEGDGWAFQAGVQLHHVRWISSQVKRPIVFQDLRRKGGRAVFSERNELTA